jgi:hypothetical protein
VPYSLIINYYQSALHRPLRRGNHIGTAKSPACRDGDRPKEALEDIAEVSSPEPNIARVASQITNT